MVLPGARTPDGVVVGARSLVTGGLDPWTIATGEPAKSRKARPRLTPEQPAHGEEPADA